MPPLPYPHRVTFLAPSMLLPDRVAHLALLYAKILAAASFDHLVRHPVVTVGDFDDERLSDLDDRLLDARHPEIEDTIDWFFRVARRDEVLWLDLSLEPARPSPVRLRSRPPTGKIEEYAAGGGGTLSEQLGRCVDLWLDARRLPRVGAMVPFGLDDLHAAVAQLDQALIAARPNDGEPPPSVPPHLVAPPPRLGVAFLRALADLSALDGHDLDQAILRLDPGHPVARRNVFMWSLGQRKDADRRAILDVIADAPMYGKPHLSVWGDQFAADRADEGMGVRHQGIAASLLPANPWACHNYSLQLNDEFRREESYRWADRATIASPSFNRAHLDCVRRLREVGRPGQAFAEAQYRCNDVLERWRAGQIAPFEWASRYHAGMLLAFVHFDVGRLDEAIRIAEDTMAEPEDAAGGESFAWARQRIAQWRSEPEILARTYAWEGYHRGDPGRVIAGFARGRVVDADDVVMLLEALVALGREDLALVGYHHFQGVGSGIVGDGRGRLLGARLHILGGDLDQAIEQILIAELRRGQSRLEADVNRTLRLACVRKADEWNGVLRRLVAKGARRLARAAARDLADFVPGLDPVLVGEALGVRGRREVDPAHLAALAAALPTLGDGAAAIDARLAAPADASLAAADLLGQEWWTVLAPPNKDRDGHAAGALYACGVALAHYLALAGGPPTPLSGAYRHVATEALHLVRRARYQIDERGARGLLELLDRSGAEEWLLDTWLLRVERALDLDTEHGGYLPSLIDGLPRIKGLLRGDERIGWELRMAWDLAADPRLGEPAGHLFERCQRALETGSAATAWSNVAAASLPAAEAIDAHWVAALANPGNHAEAWCNLARAQLALGRGDDAIEALCRAFPSTGAAWRTKTIAGFADAWAAAGIDVPFGFDDAQRAGLAALEAGDLARAARCMRWCEAQDPKNAVVKKNLGIVCARMGDVHGAVRAMAGVDRDGAGRLAGAALLEAQQHGAAVLALRYAALRFTTASDWRLLAVAGWYAEDDEVGADAYRRMVDAAGGQADAATLHAWARCLGGCGRWAEAAEVAQRLIAAAGQDPTYRSTGLHALAKALCGLGRFAEAVAPAEEAVTLSPLPENAAELAETLACAREGRAPAAKPGPESSVERQAWNALAVADLATVEQLAEAGNSWGLFRAGLAATEHRLETDNAVPVAGRALDAARMVLERTVGNVLPDAVLSRLRALRLRENGFIQIDPPPPLGGRLRTEDFEPALAQRVRDAAPPAGGPPPFDPDRARREAEGAAAAGLADDPDPMVFPGAPIARLSDYVALMKGMQAGDTMGALGRAGLDMTSYMQVATRWGQRLAADAALSARFSAMMQA